MHQQYPDLNTEGLMELFISKGHFHRYWNKYFGCLSHFPTLEAWFNQPLDAATPTTIEAWGANLYKPRFTDLKKRLTELGATWKGSKFVPLKAFSTTTTTSSSSSHHSNHSSSSHQTRRKSQCIASDDKNKKKKKK